MLFVYILEKPMRMRLLSVWDIGMWNELRNEVSG